MTSMKCNVVVITGASGFIGHSCCEYFNQKGYDVIRVGRSTQDDIYCDLARPESILMLREIYRCEAIIHLGAHVGLDNSSVKDMYMPNVVAAALIADIARARGAHLVFASTAIISGLKTEHISSCTENNPDTPYAYSKKLAEQCIVASDVPASILRIGGVFGLNGPQHLGLNRVIKGALCGQTPIIHGSGSGKRNYIYVKDLASLIFQAVQARLAGIHLVSGPEILSIAEMYQSVCEVFGLATGPLFSPGDSTRSQIIHSSARFMGTSSFRDSLNAIKKLSRGVH
jgi:UDP-glucose 4-epimerase